MKILQRNLNRSTFVVWEIERNVSVVRLICATGSSGPPASQPVSCLTRLSADLYVIWLRFCFVRGLFCLPKQTKNHKRLESKHHRRNSGSDSGCTGKDFPKYGAMGFNPVWTQMVAIVQEAGWAPGPVWTGVENLAPHRELIPGPSSL